MKKDITILFCFVDDFVQGIQEEINSQSLPSLKKTTRTPDLTDSEIVTITLMFQESPCRNFKYFYQSYL